MKSRGAVFFWSQSFAATAHKNMRGPTIATSVFSGTPGQPALHLRS
jgi:hypothetical protein